MANINTRKRAAHRRKVRAALQQILNDPAIMPNADCPDLVVSVSRVEFGRTVREIFIDVLGLRDLAYHWKSENPPGSEELGKAGLLEKLEGGTTQRLGA